jgi:hypothetical protein
MRRTWTVVWVSAMVLVSSAARAGPSDLRFGALPPVTPYSTGSCEVSGSPDGADGAWHLLWAAPPEPQSPRAGALPGFGQRLDLGVTALQAPQGAVRRPAAVEYSHAYEIRRKIHVYASVATLPLFVAETWLGQSLYNNPANSESLRGAHGAVATSIGVLFGINTVTGVWNLVEGRQNPAGRTRRTVHGVMMLAADAGFVATGLLAPHEREGEGDNAAREAGGGSPSTHRAVALSSMGIALVSYLMMYIWKD